MTDFRFKLSLAVLKFYRKVIRQLALLDQAMVSARWKAIFKTAYALDDRHEAEMALAEKTRLKALDMVNEAERGAATRRKQLEEVIRN